MLLVAAAPATASSEPTLPDTGSVTIQEGNGETVIDLNAPHHRMMM